MYNHSKLEKRAKIIKYIYSHLVMDKVLDGDVAFESGDYSNSEIKIIENIAKNYLNFKKLILKFAQKSWSWERIAPLERAILLYGCFELFIEDKALIINELVVITKGYIPGESYKFINAILSMIGDYYEKIKQNKKTS